MKINIKLQRMKGSGVIKKKSTLLEAQSIDEICNDNMILICIDFFEKYNDVAQLFRKNPKHANSEHVNFDIMVEKFGINESFEKIFDIYSDSFNKYIDSDNEFMEWINEIGVEFDHVSNNGNNIGENIIGSSCFDSDNVLHIAKYLNKIEFDLRKVGNIILDIFADYYGNCFDFVWDIIDKQNFYEDDIERFTVKSILMGNVDFIEKIIERNIVDVLKCEKIAMSKLLRYGDTEKKSEEEIRYEKLGLDTKFIWFIENMRNNWLEHSSYTDYIDEIIPK